MKHNTRNNSNIKDSLDNIHKLSGMERLLEDLTEERNYWMNKHDEVNAKLIRIESMTLDEFALYKHINKYGENYEKTKKL
jgi:hypothetical protein